jgi:Fe2+ or Zn2+ uptake regulation protein
MAEHNAEQMAKHNANEATEHHANVTCPKCGKTHDYTAAF